MTITMTDFAVQKILEMIQKSSKPTEEAYLRVGLKSGGCSGYSYFFDIVTSPETTDKIFQFSNLKVCIDKKSCLFLNGVEIDYEESLFKSGIKLNNPAATRTCGCGESVAF